MFNFLKNWQTIFQSGDILSLNYFSFLSMSYESSNCSTLLQMLNMARFWNFSHHREGVVVLHCDGHLCCPNDWYGEGNGTPLQYSCLENPMDGGAWWAAVHEVAKSWHGWATSFSLFTFMCWRRKWQPIPVFLPGESQGWGSLMGCCLWGRTESDMTEAT